MKIKYAVWYPTMLLVLYGVFYLFWWLGKQPWVELWMLLAFFVSLAALAGWNIDRESRRG